MITTQSILGTTVYGQPSGNYDGSSQDWASDAVQAANYYRGRGGLQTVTFNLSGVVAVIYLEATLDAVPETATWFTTFTYGNGTTPLTALRSETVLGNFTWIRVRVDLFDAGTINSITVAY
jgi:hypothetical protein